MADIFLGYYIYCCLVFVVEKKVAYYFTGKRHKLII